ncbi:hypothetical protein F5Y13DRAFT_167189 [Hypoxylon sp. FL1857]|nr:hypothetical protein F5Y13DRAFT_167189 [Hypoxylon sp. FL1857]
MDELLMRLDAMQSSETARPPAIEWTRYRPPRQYHHESFFNSLEDTPELFESYQADGRVRAHLFSLPDIHGPPAPGLESDVLNVNHMLGEGRVSIIDLKASMPGQWNSHTWQGYKHESSTLSALSVIKKKLSDSLVDQEVQHRMIILSAASSTNTLNDLRLFWRAFHIDSRDCFVNHDTKFPDFSCQKGNAWNTRITLRSWSKSIGRRTQSKAEDMQPLNSTNRNPEPTGGIVYERGDLRRDRLKEEDAPIEIPQSLKNSLRFINQDAFNHENDSPSVVELQVSSIVLSTNDFGDFSQCTIISELLEGKSKEVGDQCKELWERFIHQPQTARCLVFLTILGLLCQQMAIEYRNSMDYFIQFIHAFEIEKSFTFDENNLLKGTHGIMQLKLGLWSLESLFKLHNSLVTSMRCIEEASTELRAQIDYGPGKRGERLERMCQHSLGDFERKLTQLVVLSDELNQKIKLNSRYKDSVSLGYSHF